MEFDISTLHLLLGTIIPLLVGLVAKKVAHSGFKGFLNALLSAASAVVATLIANEGVLGPVQEIIQAGFTTFVVSIATYYGIWKPSGVAEKVQDSTAEFGLDMHLTKNG